MSIPFPKNKNNNKSLMNTGQEGWWKNAWRQGKKALAKPPKARGLLFEALEPRVLMSADLSYGTALGDPTDLTLTFFDDTTTPDNSEYRLVNSSNFSDIVSSTKATEVINNEITITGTGGDDILRLNLDNLASPLSLLFKGDGTDSLVAEGDVNFSLSDMSLTAGSKTFTLLNAADSQSFEHAGLTGGSSANQFTLTSWSGSVMIDGKGGTDTLNGPEADFDWQITGSDSGFITNGTFTGIENLKGGNATDAFKIDAGGSLSGLIDGGSGDNALVADNIDNTWLISGTDQGDLNGLAFTGIRNLIGGTGGDRFVFEDGAGITGIIEGGSDPDDGDPNTPIVPAIDILDYTAYTAKVSVNTGTGLATGTAGYQNIDTFAGGASANDEILGSSDASVVWTVSGPDEVSVANISFSSFENLTGAGGNTDVFVITGTGSVSGRIDGGTGGGDGLVFINPGDSTQSRVYNPAGTDSSGTATLFSKAIAYARLDRVDFYNDSDPLNPVITGTIFNDSIRVYADGTSLKIKFEGSSLYDAVTGSSTDEITLLNQEVSSLVSLRIDAIEGADTITVDSLPAGFAGSLYLYGNRLQRADLIFPKMAEDDPYPDSVVINGDISLGYLEVFADNIKVNNNVHITAGDGIFFRNRNIGTATVENLLPVFATVRSVSVDIGKNAILEGGDIYFVTQAEDKSLSDVIGANKEISNFVIDPLTDRLGELVALPVKVLVKQSSATITLQQGAQLLSSGTIGMYATATADASGSASSSLVSIGYGQANATAKIDIQKNVVIDAAAAAVVTATGGATAGISASTTRELKSTPNPGSKQVALAIGVAYANVVSHVTVAEGASITAGKTANVTAVGDISAEATGEAGIFAEGAAGLGFGIEVSKADIHTTVNGTITARMEPGAVVKLEIDPTVAKADYKNDQTIVGLKTGKTVEALGAVGSLPAGTVFKYIGSTLNGSVNLSTQDYGDGTIWEETTPASVTLITPVTAFFSGIRHW